MAVPQIVDIQAQLKNQLQAYYADKSILEDKIFELKAQIQGFSSCLNLQEQIESAEAEEAIKETENGNDDPHPAE